MNRQDSQLLNIELNQVILFNGSLEMKAICPIPIGLFLTIFCAIGVAGGMEFKDKEYGNKWDWLDFGFTVLGGLIGQSLWLLSLVF